MLRSCTMIASGRYRHTLFNPNGNLEKAISVMNKKYRDDFHNYVKDTSILHPNIMCISKSKILNLWFTDLFEWLFNCEKVFGFDNLKGYDTGRLYAYLAERFLPFLRAITW